MSEQSRHRNWRTIEIQSSSLNSISIYARGDDGIARGHIRSSFKEVVDDLAKLFERKFKHELKGDKLI